VARTISRSLRSDTVRYAPALVSAAVTGFASIIVWTRLVTPSVLGEYTLAYSTVVLVASVLGGGIQQAVLRYFTEYQISRELHVLLPAVALCIALGAVVSAALGGLALAARVNPLGALLWLTVLACVLELAGATLGSVVRAAGRASLYSNTYTAGSLVRIVAGTALAIRWPTAQSLLAGGVAANCLVLAVLLWSARRSIARTLTRLAEQRARMVPVWSAVERIARFGLPMAAWFAFGLVFTYSDRYSLAAFGGTHLVGIYSPNYSLGYQSILLVAAPMLMAAHPLIMKARGAGDQREVADVLSHAVLLYLRVAVPICAVVSLASREIAEVLLPTAYRHGWPVIVLIALASLVWNLAQYAHKPFEALDQTATLSKLVAVCAVVNAALVIGLTSRFGIFGAAAGYAASCLVYCVTVFVVGHRRMRWEIPVPSIAAALLPALLGSAAVAATLPLTLADPLARLVVKVAAFAVAWGVVTARQAVRARTRAAIAEA